MLSRREFILGSLGLLAACKGGKYENGIETRQALSPETLDYVYRLYPELKKMGLVPRDIDYLPLSGPQTLVINFTGYGYNSDTTNNITTLLIFMQIHQHSHSNIN